MSNNFSGSASGVVGAGGFSLDIGTDVGKIRVLIADSDSSAFTFTDGEIGVFLTMVPGNLYNAAALACETWARSQAKLSKSRKDGDGTMVTRYSPVELLALANSLRNAALTSGGLVTDTIDVSNPGELLDSFREEWHGINELPEVR